MRSLPRLLLTLCCCLAPIRAWARPPYEVLGYCYQTQNANGQNLNLSTDIPWADLTQIGDAFAIPNYDGTLDIAGGGGKGAPLIAAAHANGVRCYLSIGGGGQDGAFPTISSPANLANFVSQVASTVTQYGYDGVDIDWEFPANSQSGQATAMMQALYPAIKALSNSSVDGKPRTLSFTITAYANACSWNFNTIGSYVDYGIIMGYDYYTDVYNGPLGGEPSSGTCNNSGSFPVDLEGDVQQITNGSVGSFPKSKLIIACPLYVNDYNAGNEIDVLSVLKQGRAGAYQSAQAEQLYTWTDGNQVAVDTSQSYCDKINWALSQGFKGIGMWDIGQALPYTDPAVSGLWNTIGGQASCLNLGPTPTPVVSNTWRVNAGGPQYTDSQGHVWSADEDYSGGTAATPSTAGVANALPGAADQSLYQTQRYGSAFSYSFNVPAGSYQVTLKFAETYFTAAADREFNVSINGTTVLSNFDVFASAGGENLALDEVFQNIAPSGGLITINFGPASVNNAVIQAIQIIPEPSATATPTRTPSSTATSSPSLTATRSSTVTATRTFSATPTRSVSTTASPSFTPTQTAIPSHSASPSPSATASLSPTTTISPAPTKAFSQTFTATLSPSSSPSTTASPLPSADPSPSASKTLSPSFSATPTATVSATFSPSPSSTPSASPTDSPSASPTRTVSVMSTSTMTPSPSATPSVVVTGSSSPTKASSPTDSPTLTRSSTATPSIPATQAPSATASPTLIVSPSPPAQGRAPLQVLSSAPYPNPNPGKIAVQVSGGPAVLHLKIYSVSLRFLAQSESEAVGPGWVQIGLPAGFLAGAAPNGVYYYQLSTAAPALGGAVGRFVILK